MAAVGLLHSWKSVQRLFACERVGSAVGSGEGPGVGAEVGSGVGPEVGAEVGSEVGDSVGEFCKLRRPLLPPG